MNVLTIVIIAAAAVIVAIVLAWILSSGKARAAYQAALHEKDADIIRREGEAQTLRQLRETESAQYKQTIEDLRAENEKALAISRAEHEKALEALKADNEKAIAELRAGQEKAIEAAKTALALENEKLMKAREESLKKEAAETMKVITGDLNKDIKDMKDAFDAQKKSHAEESSSIKTQFEETVKNLRHQTEAIGNTAEDLAKALKGQSKVQGIFGETILENILKGEGLREGHDYDAEFWLRDKKGNRIENEETGKKMRPDFALHFPDNTDILIDSKVSLTALSDYFAAETDEERADASRRNLESVESHIRELTSKEYQKYVVGRKTLDYVIMFIPNYSAYQLAKMEDKEIFAKAFNQNVLITTEETLIPFLRLIRTAWVQKEQMENISEIVSAAQDMVERVGIFCRYNAALENDLEKVLDEFRSNSKRLVDGKQSIVKAAMKAVDHGVVAPSGKNALPSLGPALPGEE